MQNPVTATNQPAKPAPAAAPAPKPKGPKLTLRQKYKKYMLLVAVAGNGIFYVQFGKILWDQSAKDVSLLAFCVSVWALSSWLIYGLFERDWVIIIANIVGVIGALLVVWGKLHYG